MQTSTSVVKMISCLPSTWCPQEAQLWEPTLPKGLLNFECPLVLKVTDRECTTSVCFAQSMLKYKCKTIASQSGLASSAASEKSSRTSDCPHHPRDPQPTPCTMNNSSGHVAEITIFHAGRDGHSTAGGSDCTCTDTRCVVRTWLLAPLCARRAQIRCSLSNFNSPENNSCNMASDTSQCQRGARLKPA